MELSNIGPMPGAKKKAKRVGRGESSGIGKTCGRGGKGQTARNGGFIPARFEGGQMPLYRRIPKFGFNARKQYLGLNDYTIVNLDMLEKFDANATVDASSLESRGLSQAHTRKAGIKVLGTGTLTKKLTVKVNAISASAKARIEALGGTVEIVAE